MNAHEMPSAGEGAGRSDVNDPSQPRVIVVQDGARLRYALPLALQSAGLLETMHTDWYVRHGSPEAVFAALMGHLPHRAARRLAGRRAAGLDDDKIVACSWTTLIERLCESRGARAEELYIRRSRAMARQVLQHGWSEADGLAGFVRNVDPLLCESARRRGMVVVLDQMIAPIRVEARAAKHQATLWPGWEKPVDPIGSMLMQDVERRSWAAADHITCASDYVRDGLISEGVDPVRISVIPYPVDAEMFRFVDRSARNGPVRVGFVGAVSLRKGAPAFLRIARAFDPNVAEFAMVGQSMLEGAMLARARGEVRLVGAVPAAAIPTWLHQFDIFLFPSTCEGSAGAVMEAMAMGLPIVTTPESGTVVRYGIEGFVYLSDDVDGMAGAIERLVADPDLRARMGRAARRRVESMSVERYGAAWRAVLEDVL